MGNIRAFIAVEIEDQAKQKILELITSLKKSSADIKWITENQIHVTLEFLGTIAQDKIKAISDNLSAISKDFKPFTITFFKIGAFPNLSHPKVIWLGIDKGAEALGELNKAIENNLEKLGFEKEIRGFKAHLTLGRVKSTKNISGLIDILEKQPLISIEPSQINSLTLFQSSLTPKGAIYSNLSKHNLNYLF